METPTPEPAPPPEAPPPEPESDTAYLEMQAAAEAARSRVLANGFDSAYPDEWIEAEELYNQDTAEGYTEAARRYDEIYRTAITDRNALLVEMVADARKAAIDAGAGVDFPEHLIFADSKREEFNDLLGQSGSEEEAYEAGLNALVYYQALEKTASSFTLMRRIDSLGFAEYDPEDYNAALDCFIEAEYLLEQGAEPEAILEFVTDGHELFMQVLNNGFGVLAEREQEKASAAKAESDSIRAGVILKDKYVAAQELYNQAAAYLGEGQNEDAWRLFEAASTAFANVYQEALIRRNAAQAAMDSANRKVEEVDYLADEADILAPLPDDPEPEEDIPEETERIEPEAVGESAPADETIEQGGQE
ncbi:MAG: hypothetical protein LBR47_05040 [Spirochaetaceae bacterium]|nr:hypothetical protein [Spirochaetaceae bacterium]